MRAIDLTGQRYGRLVALERDRSQVGRIKWRCRCDCGGEVSVTQANLKSGNSESCGCLRAEQISRRSVTHGHQLGRRASKTLQSYRHAKSRCFNPNVVNYPQYGGRGISMCKRWADSFEEFLADMGECPPGLTLDRIDVNGDYEPRNCRWAAIAVQARNKTNNILVTHEGETMILTDFARRMGVSYKALRKRVRDRGQAPYAAALAMLLRAS